MSLASDCAAVASAFGIQLDSNCCDPSGIAQCIDNRVTTVNGLCSVMSQDGLFSACDGTRPWCGKGFPQGLDALSNLEVLFLDGCALTGPLPDNWNGFPSLRQIHLQGNSLGGALPASFGALTAMQYFHVQGNQFTGDLPAGMANWGIVSYCEVQNNCFTGTSPNAKCVLFGERTDCPAVSSPDVSPANSLPVEQLQTTAAVAPANEITSTTAAFGVTSAPLKMLVPSTASTASIAGLATSGNDSSSSQPNIPIIAGIGAGVLILFVILGLSVWLCIRNKNRRSNNSDFVEGEGMHRKKYAQDHQGHKRDEDHRDGSGRRNGQPSNNKSYRGDGQRHRDEGPGGRNLVRNNSHGRRDRNDSRVPDRIRGREGDGSSNGRDKSVTRDRSVGRDRIVGYQGESGNGRRDKSDERRKNYDR